MKIIDATEAKNKFGVFIQESLVEPVGVRKNGSVISIMLSKNEFERLKEIENAYYGIITFEADKEGYMSVEETKAFINEKLNEDDQVREFSEKVSSET